MFSLSEQLSTDLLLGWNQQIVFPARLAAEIDDAEIRNSKKLPIAWVQTVCNLFYSIYLFIANK